MAKQNKRTWNHHRRVIRRVLKPHGIRLPPSTPRGHKYSRHKR